MDPTVWTELAKQGVASVIALSLCIWLVLRLTKMLEQISRNQDRHTALMYRLLRELGVTYDGGES